jgi:hypothetical protein
LPVVTITNPVNGSNQIDGTPPLNWSVVGGHGQSAWKAEYRNAVGKLIDDSNGFADDSVTRTWTPSTGIAVPADAGTYRLVVKDDSVTRAGAANAPTQVEVTSSFVTVESSAVSGITGLAVNIVNGAVTLTGNRGAGAPDNVSVLGDPLLMPGGAKFFTGGNFSIPDYTCDLRRQHTWKIVTYVGGTAAGSATIVARPFDGGCYLIDPVTGFKIEVWGQDDVPSVEEIVTENSILHVPVTGGPIVEPVRRRLTRTTKAGTITGVVQDSDATTLQGWVEGPQQKRFRLVYGIANLSVILGDYNPQNVFYSEQLSAERTLFTLNWWERLNP